MTIFGMRPRPTCEAMVIEQLGNEAEVSFWYNHRPPTDNGQRELGRGRYRPNPMVGRFKDLTAWAARQYRVPRLAGWRVIRFHHVFATNTHGDPSNYIKVTQDALQFAGVIENDKYVLASVESVHYPWDPNPPAGGWKIGMGVIVAKADPSAIGTPRPDDWKPAERWIDPAPANIR